MFTSISSLTEKKLVAIRPVDPNVASGAVLEAPVKHVMRGGLGDDASAIPPKLVGSVVTFQTHGKHYRPPKQSGIHGPMRVVASLASIHSDRRVLEHEWTSFIGVTLQAG